MSYEPELFQRRILLAVTGGSPQVVTETLYALAVEREPAFVPTEIHVISTSTGLERARLMLLDPDEGHFHALVEEYGLPGHGIRFDEECLHVICDDAGNPLPDIVDEAGNEAAANLILETVRHFCSDENTAVHASLAGGRKTMGYYLGYAMSLLGRHQDRLSHVLVNPPFESSHDFFYPPARPRRITVRDQPAHTSDARIMLADIPFVRMSSDVTVKGLQSGTGFSEAVEQVQASLDEPKVHIDLDSHTLRVQGRAISMSRTQLGWYAWFAMRVLAGRPGVVLRETNRNDVAELEMLLEEMGMTEQQTHILQNADDIEYEMLAPTLSRIKQRFRKQLGTETDYEIRNIGEHNNATYRLPLRADQISVRGFNRDEILERIRANAITEEAS